MSPTLRKFATDPNTFVGNDFFDCLQACTHLTSLTSQRSSSYAIPPLDDSPANMSDNLLSRLMSPNEEGEYLCPLLDTLECCEPPDFADKALYEFISRKQSGSIPGISKLERVNNYFNRVATVPRTEELETFIKQGLSFEVTYTAPPLPRNQFSALDGLPYSLGSSSFYIKLQK
ncbi:hypothetical protein CPB83DRAFT_902708 [Crepidotus variabilis]|uniref:Uncharacterized protein n=1 Tax=Crepidotus variabilis TaxID=179855 RepID=A0A9P6ESV2_9AGAR|nr:hypothetical protein CPB83DRAFT_902708 [Crepidotus variabilis]